MNVDDNWMEKTRAANGSLVYRADKFPRGMKVLADHAHSKGLKFGIYSAHGARTCMGNAASGGDTPHWQQDADLFASWGVDYLKLDSCGGYEKNYTADPAGRQYANYAAMRDALNATGRPIYYSICEINAVIESAAVKDSPSACGHTSAYTSLPWHAEPSKYPVPALANSVLIEWVNNNNEFCHRTPGKPHCCQRGWVSQIDSQQDLTIDSLSGPGFCEWPQLRPRRHPRSTVRRSQGTTTTCFPWRATTRPTTAQRGRPARATSPCSSSAASSLSGVSKPAR